MKSIFSALIIIFSLFFTMQTYAHCTWQHPGHCVEEPVRNVGKAVEKAAQDTGKTVEKAVQDTGKTIEKAVQDTGKTVEKAIQDTGKTIEKAAHDTGKILDKTGREIGNASRDIDRWARTGKCGGDICDTVGKAIKDTEAEGKRTIENLEEAGKAAVKFTERQVQGVGKTLSDAEKRIREGKVIDAVWHLATDPVKHTEDNAAKLAQESKYIRAVGQVAAGAYGGPGGSAAYAAWLTYKQTGDFELALKTGLITGATSYANAEIATIPSDELVAKTVLAGAVGGAAVAASGGDNQAVLEGFLLSGGMVLVQDGYKKIAGHDLDKDSLKHSEGPPYCLKVTQAALKANSGNSCIPKEDIYARDSDGRILYEDNEKTIPVFKDKSKLMAKLDNRRPHVGLMAAPDKTGVLHETGGFMQGVSKVPGMNAMSVFHDQWAVNWDMDPITTVATIPPAIVITYLGAGGPSYDLIRKTNIKNNSKKKDSYIKSAKSKSTALGIVDKQSDSTDLYLDEESFIGQSYICSKANLVRQIAVEYPPPGEEHQCRVLYDTENGLSTPWAAKNEKSYCLPRAQSLVAKHIVEFGWECSGQ